MPKQVLPQQCAPNTATGAVGTAKTWRDSRSLFALTPISLSRFPGWFTGILVIVLCHNWLPLKMHFYSSPYSRNPVWLLIFTRIGLQDRKRSEVVHVRIKYEKKKKKNCSWGWCPGQRHSSWDCGFSRCFAGYVRDHSMNSYGACGLELIKDALLATVLDQPWLSYSIDMGFLGLRSPGTGCGLQSWGQNLGLVYLLGRPGTWFQRGIGLTDFIHCENNISSYKWEHF